MTKQKSRRKWRVSGLADHGFSRSALRDLDAAERLNDDLRDACATIDLDADIRSARVDLDSVRVDLNSVRVDLDGGIEITRLADSRIPDVSIRAADALIPERTAAEVATDITTKVLDVHEGIAIPPAADLPFTMVDVQREISNTAVSFFSELRRREGSLLSKDLSNAIGALGNKALYKLTKPVAETMKQWIDAQNLLNDRLMRQMDHTMKVFETSIAETMRHRMRPVFDSLGRHVLEEIFETIERTDWQTVVEAWRVQEARRPRTKIGFAALAAYDALNMDHPWVADKFLVGYLRVEVNDDTREALWIVLREAFERTIPSPATWLLLDDEQATRYLRGAIYKVAKRVRRDKERPDRVWWPEGEMEEDKEGRKLSEPNLSPNTTLDFIVPKTPGPEKLLLPPLNPKAQVLEMLYFEGTAQDKKLVEMFIAGLDLPEVAAIVGWQEVQRFQRKAQRWIKRKL